MIFMETKNVSELKSIIKEWGTIIMKTFHQIDKEIGFKGWLFVVFGIVVICLLGNIADSI